MRASPQQVVKPRGRSWRHRAAGRWPLGVLVAALLALTVLAACDSNDRPDPTPTTPATVPVGPPKTVGYDSSVRKIPLEGPAESPIGWRLPEELDSEEEAAVLAIRLNLTLNTLVESRSEPADLAPLYVAIADSTQLISRYQSTRLKQLKDGAGPRWYWLDTPRLGDDGLLHVAVCQDLAWVQGRNVPATVPRPAARRSEVSNYGVKVPAAFPLQGKVNLVGTKVNAPPYDVPWDRSCAAWAKHTPKGEG